MKLKTKPERKHEHFWTNNDGVVVEAVGWSCEPNEFVWWFPTLGYSTNQVFKKKSKAVNVAKQECKAQISYWQRKLKKLTSPRT